MSDCLGELKDWDMGPVSLLRGTPPFRLRLSTRSAQTTRTTAKARVIPVLALFDFATRVTTLIASGLSFGAVARTLF
jgi:hypothetical protein